MVLVPPLLDLLSDVLGTHKMSMSERLVTAVQPFTWLVVTCVCVCLFAVGLHDLRFFVR